MCLGERKGIAVVALEVFVQGSIAGSWKRIERGNLLEGQSGLSIKPFSIGLLSMNRTGPSLGASSCEKRLWAWDPLLTWFLWTLNFKKGLLCVRL